MAKTKYFILGEQASSFSDQKSGLTISNQNVGQADAKAFRNSKASVDALRSGHIKEVSEGEAMDLKKKNGQLAAEKSVKEQEQLRELKEKKKLDKLRAGKPITNDNADDEEEEEEEEVEQDETDEDDEDENESEDDDEDEDNNPETMTKGQLKDAILANDKIPAEKKKGLSKLGIDDLKALYATGN